MMFGARTFRIGESLAPDCLSLPDGQEQSSRKPWLFPLADPFQPSPERPSQAQQGLPLDLDIRERAHK